MDRTFALIGVTFGGWVGWALGSPLSLFAGLFGSLVGTGLGIWLAARVVRDYF